MQISGVIKIVVYHNVDNGYSVVKIDTGSELVVATGKFPMIGEGEVVNLEGEFKVNPKFGEQFCATNISIHKPSSIEQIEKYLCSGLIAGVGPVTAHAIVQKFKEETFDIIENSPTKLSEVRGISLKKALEIHKTYNDIQKMQNAVMFLQKYDISINMAVKIYSKYKNRTEDVLNTNPYKLVEDIDGIGFKTADKLAVKLGVEKTSPFRLRAGLLFCLGEIASKLGSTIIEKQKLFFETTMLLELNNENIEEQLKTEEEKLLIERLVREIDIDGNTYVAISSYYEEEKTIATKLLSLFNFGEEIKYDVVSDIALYEQQNKITLSDGQKRAIATAVSSAVVVLTGGPGTGKTTIVKSVLQILRNMEKKCLLLAPTGRAAKRLEETTKTQAFTIHRALEINFQSKSRSFTYNEENPLEAQVVIVDEASMLDTFVLSSLLRALRVGTKIVLVGDKDQLPSVGAGNVLADIIASQMFPVVELTQIYRQAKESKITINAHKVNNCEMPDLTEKSDDFFFISRDNAESACEEIVGLVKNRLPKFLNTTSDKIQIIAPMKAGFCGVDNMNVRLQQELNPSDETKAEITLVKRVFRVGDRVMQTANNYEQEWCKEDARGFLDFGTGVFNGDMGTITEITEATREVVVEFEDGRVSNYSMIELEDLTLSYAITVHKSQGSEFDVVIVPIFGGNPMLFNKNLLYTALTRAKKMVVLIGNAKSIFSMVKNKMVNKRETLLKLFLQTIKLV